MLRWQEFDFTDVSMFGRTKVPCVTENGTVSEAQGAWDPDPWLTNTTTGLNQTATSKLSNATAK